MFCGKLLFIYIYIFINIKNNNKLDIYIYIYIYLFINLKNSSKPKMLHQCWPVSKYIISVLAKLVQHPVQDWLPYSQYIFFGND